jgi:hypothetical protein
MHPSALNQRNLWRGVLIVVLCVALATPAPAQAGGGRIGASNGTIAGAIVGIVAAVVVVTVVAIHYSKKRAITGCVNSAGSGMTITDEKDKQVYALSGDTAGIKSGDRMKL